MIMNDDERPYSGYPEFNNWGNSDSEILVLIKLKWWKISKIESNKVHGVLENIKVHNFQLEKNINYPKGI